MVELPVFSLPFGIKLVRRTLLSVTVMISCPFLLVIVLYSLVDVNSLEHAIMASLNVLDIFTKFSFAAHKSITNNHLGDCTKLMIRNVCHMNKIKLQDFLFFFQRQIYKKSNCFILYISILLQ